MNDYKAPSTTAEACAGEQTVQNAVLAQIKPDLAHFSSLYGADAALCYESKKRAFCRARFFLPYNNNISGYEQLNIINSALQQPKDRDLRSLITLDAGRSKLRFLDTARLSQLKQLDLYYSLISTLDTTSLTSLEQLDASGTNITSLNTAPLARLQILRLNRCRIEELDTSCTPALKSLDILQTGVKEINTKYLSELEELYIGQSAIYYVDLRPTPKLKLLHAEGTVRVLDLDYFTKLAYLDVFCAPAARIGFPRGLKIERLQISSYVIKYCDFRQKCEIGNLHAFCHQLMLWDALEQQNTTK